MKQRTSQPRKTAEILAIQVLAFIADEPERLTGFLTATGLTVQGLRAAANERDLLAGVLEHMLADERLLIAFADSAGIDPNEVAAARSTLDGHRGRDVP